MAGARGHRRGLRRWRTIAALAAAAAAVSGPISPSDAEASEVRFIRDARSDFDRYLTGASSASQSWMRQTYWRMRGYVPFFSEHAVSWAPPTDFYKDSYAIYNDRKNRPGRPDLDTLAQHPRWVLRDRSGRRLYIPFNCSGGKCPQFAADLGNPNFRAWWIRQARIQLSDGYRGIYVDDVNFEWRISNGNGQFVRPIDPRTQKPMTLTAWRGYFARFLEQIQRAFPNRQISHNSLWWVDRGDRNVRRQVAAADFVQIERGFNDRGVVNGNGKYGYVTLLRHIRWLHRTGASVILKPYDLTVRKAEYELANHLLTRLGRDALMSEFRADPGRFWHGWRTDLGRPQGTWFRWKGLFRRDFSRGMVLVNQPGARRTSVRVGGRLRDLSGDRTRRVTLGAASGKVLKRG